MLTTCARCTGPPSAVTGCECNELRTCPGLTASMDSYSSWTGQTAHMLVYRAPWSPGRDAFIRVHCGCGTSVLMSDRRRSRCVHIARTQRYAIQLTWAEPKYTLEFIRCGYMYYRYLHWKWKNDKWLELKPPTRKSVHTLQIYVIFSLHCVPYNVKLWQ